MGEAKGAPTKLTGKIDDSSWDVLRMGRGHAGRLAQRNSKEWHHKASEATRLLAYAPQ